MNFEQYFADAVGRGMNPEHRPAMLCAWDAALCAASLACRDQGRLKDSLTMAAEISNLHSWVTPTTEAIS